MAVYVHRTGMEKCVEKCPPLIISVPLVNKKMSVSEKYLVIAGLLRSQANAYNDRVVGLVCGDNRLKL